MFFPLTLALAFKSLLRNNKVKLGIIDTIWCEFGIELNWIALKEQFNDVQLDRQTPTFL